MIRRTIFINSQQACELMDSYLHSGYVIDPILHDGKPFTTDAGLVMPLVKYESEEERPKVLLKAGEFDDVIETREVSHGVVPEGFAVHAIYAKAMIVVKRREAQ